MSNTNLIEDRIRQFIIQNLYFLEDEFIANDASFLETGVVDSTGVAELVGFVQSEFGIRVESGEILVQNFDSIEKLAAFVRRKLAAANPAQPSPLAPQLASGPDLLSPQSPS